MYLVSFRHKYNSCCFLQQTNNNRTICWTNERSQKESCRVISKAPVMNYSCNFKCSLWIHLLVTLQRVFWTAQLRYERMCPPVLTGGMSEHSTWVCARKRNSLLQNNFLTDFYFVFRFSLRYGTRSAFSCVITVGTSVSFLSYIFPLLHIPCK